MLQNGVPSPEGTVMGVPVMDPAQIDLGMEAGLEEFLHPPAA